MNAETWLKKAELGDVVYLNRTTDNTKYGIYTISSITENASIIAFGVTNISGNGVYAGGDIVVIDIDFTVVRVDNNVNNYMLTATGGLTINGESKLTYDGSELALFTTTTGDVEPQYISYKKIGPITTGIELGKLVWWGGVGSDYGAAGAIWVEAAENWGSPAYGSNLYIATTSLGGNVFSAKIAIIEDSTYIKAGNLIVENNCTVQNLLSVTDGIHNTGRFDSKISKVTASPYTGTTTDYTIISEYSSLGDPTIVLPEITSGEIGRIIIVKNSTGSKTLSVSAYTGDTIVITSGNGVPTFTIPTNGYAATLQSDGTSKWYLIGALAATTF